MDVVRRSSTHSLQATSSSFAKPVSPNMASPSSLFMPTTGTLNPLDEMHQYETLNAIGEGPMRFGPIFRRQSVQESLLKCHVSSMDNFMRLKQACTHHGIDGKFTEDQILQVATYKDFSVGKALRLLKKMDPRYINTTIDQVEEQLKTYTLFPLPRIHSPNIDSFFYMRPCRYDPRETPTSTIIANLIYVMDAIYQRHRDYENRKIGFIANMNDWTMQHFSVDYCFQFMQALQGRLAPVNVDLFLIVNPPAWFGKIWKIMKPMLSPVFRKKVHMISEDKLHEYFAPGFDVYLPNEFECGKSCVETLVSDFVTFRQFVEKASPIEGVKSASHPIWSPNFSENSQRRRNWMRRMSMHKVASHRHVLNRRQRPVRRKSNEAKPSVPPPARRLSLISSSAGDESCNVSVVESENSDEVSIRLLE